MTTFTTSQLRSITLTWGREGCLDGFIAASVGLDDILETQRQHLKAYHFTSKGPVDMYLCQAMKDTLRHLAYRSRNRGEANVYAALTGILIPSRCWSEIAGGLLIRIGPRGRRHSQFAILTNEIPEADRTLTLKS